jgi:hypothetical protein
MFDETIASSWVGTDGDAAHRQCRVIGAGSEPGDLIDNSAAIPVIVAKIECEPNISSFYRSYNFAACP